MSQWISGMDRIKLPDPIGKYRDPLKRNNNGRIVGGIETQPHAWPHQVGLFFSSALGRWFCGGSIISKIY